MTVSKRRSLLASATLAAVTVLAACVSAHDHHRHGPTARHYHHHHRQVGGVRYTLTGEDVFYGRLDVTASTRHGDGSGNGTSSLKELCDPGVEQEAGYYRVTGTRDLNMFYWFFESRSNPATDPVILWMTGGPGCSDATALFAENEIDINAIPCLQREDWRDLGVPIGHKSRIVSRVRELHPEVFS